MSQADSVVPAAGKEWIVDASRCNPASLRDETTLSHLVDTILSQLSLRTLLPPLWHVFPGEAGVTAMVLLAESHLTLHTFPEHRTLTLNVYSCRERRPMDFRATLREHVGAEVVSVRELERGTPS